MINGRRGRFLTGLRWVLVGTWTGFIWWLVTLPEKQAPDIGYIPLGDKLGHLGVFCVWAILACSALEKSFRVLSRRGAAVLSVLGAMTYGIVVEMYQTGIGRDAEFLDVLADTVGALIGVYLYHSAAVRRLLTKGLRTLAASGASVTDAGTSLPLGPERGGEYAPSELEEEKE